MNLGPEAPVVSAPVSRETHLRRLRPLLDACAAYGPVDYSLAKLAQDTPPATAPARDAVVARVWHRPEPPYDLLAVAALHGNRNLVFLIHPAVRSGVTEAAMLEWIAQQVALVGKAQPNAKVWAHLDFGEDAYHCVLLERAGFARVEAVAHRMARPLDARSTLGAAVPPLLSPDLPVGFAIRTVGGDDDLQRFVALFHDAFGDGPSVDGRRRLRQRPNHLPELVVVDPHGQYVSFCSVQVGHTAQLPLVEGEAIVYQLGTARAHWHRGFGRAALRAGLLQMREHGVHTARLHTAARNIHAQSLFESEGFRRTGTVTNVRYVIDA